MLEGASQQGLQEDWAKAEQKHPWHGLGSASCGNLYIAEVFLSTETLHIDNSTQDLEMFTSRADGK